MRDWDLIRFGIFLRFDSKRGIRQPNLEPVVGLNASTVEALLLRLEMLPQQQADPSS